MSGQIIFKRFFYLVAVFLFTTMIAFMLCNQGRHDPLRIRFAEMSQNEYGFYEFSHSASARALQKEWGLDLPLFYFSLKAYSEPDTMYKIPDRQKRETAVALLSKNGDWPKVQAYFQSIDHAIRRVSQITPQSDTLVYIREQLSGMCYNADSTYCKSRMDTLTRLLRKNPAHLNTLYEILSVRNHAIQLRDSRMIYKNYLPKLTFYGFQNQYHRWLSLFFSGNAGKTYRNGEDIPQKLFRHIRKSAQISFLSFVMVFLLGILLGIHRAVYPETRFSRLMEGLGLFLNAIPAFIVGVILIYLLANQNTLPLFTYDFQSDSYPFLKRIPLPLIAYSIGGILSLSALVNAKMKAELSTAYIRTAHAKGLSLRRIVWVHALKNLSPTLITVGASLFPALLSGSIVLERLFNIGGMGEATLEAIESGESVLLMSVIAITVLFTVMGYLLADIFSAWIDKRRGKSS
ncbi:MAG: ABC transporter permease [Bacteroidia bacterium]|nr:ABC transporter permease [Bacteroidia bacterium]